MVMEIPVRMRQTRTRPEAWESLLGFKCQIWSTRLAYCLAAATYALELLGECLVEFFQFFVSVRLILSRQRRLTGFGLAVANRSFARGAALGESTAPTGRGDQKQG